MKVWTQDMLPLKIVKDLGVIKATPKSLKKTRFIEFECPKCYKTFKAPPSKVANNTTNKCGPCGLKSKSPQIDSKSNTKKCTACLITKPLKDFFKSSRREDGYDTRCKKCMKEYKKQWEEGNIESINLKRDNARLIKRYGITQEEYYKLLKLQNYSCAICGISPEESRKDTKKLSVDHDHKTGEIRGLLCHRCNTGIGLLGDTKEGLVKALDYLGT